MAICCLYLAQSDSGLWQLSSLLICLPPSQPTCLLPPVSHSAFLTYMCFHILSLLLTYLHMPSFDLFIVLTIKSTQLLAGLHPPSLFSFLSFCLQCYAKLLFSSQLLLNICNRKKKKETTKGTPLLIYLYVTQYQVWSE